MTAKKKQLCVQNTDILVLFMLRFGLSYAFTQLSGFVMYSTINRLLLLFSCCCVCLCVLVFTSFKAASVDSLAPATDSVWWKMYVQSDHSW